MTRRQTLPFLVLFAVISSGCSASYSTDQGKTIAPDDAFYSFKVPNGFFVEDKSALNQNPARQVESGVYFPGSTATVRVSQQELTGTLPAAEEIERAFMSQARSWPFPPKGWQHIKVLGLPALRYELAGKGTHEEETAIFAGAHLVYVSCIWEKTKDKRTASDGCRSVTNSLSVEH